jgi:hypothetical protein
MRRNFTRLGGLMILALMSLPLTGQNEGKAVHAIQGVEQYVPEQGVQLRDVSSNVDSVVRYSSSGETLEKFVYPYLTFSSSDQLSFNEEVSLLWIPQMSNRMGYIVGSYFDSENPDIVLYSQVFPYYDEKGQLTRIETKTDEDTDNRLSYQFTYNENGQIICILQYSYYGEYTLISSQRDYQYNGNGDMVYFEEYGWRYQSYDPPTGAYKYIWDRSLRRIAKFDSQGRKIREDRYIGNAAYQKYLLDEYDIYYYSDAPYTPNVETGNNTPVGEDNKGGFDINITFPADSIAGGSLTVRLPDGLTLDKDNTRLTIDLGDFELVITQQEDNSWLLELKPKTLYSASLRSDGDVGQLLHVAYTVGANVKRGIYDATVHSILFETPGGSAIVEPAIAVPINVNRWGVGNEQATTSEPSVYISGSILTVQSNRAEQVTVYSVSGAKLYEGRIQAGTTTIATTRFPQGILIVKGDSGWTKKVIN